MSLKCFASHMHLKEICKSSFYLFFYSIIYTFCESVIRDTVCMIYTYFSAFTIFPPARVITCALFIFVYGHYY